MDEKIVNNTQINIDDLNEVQIKALLYDQIVEADRININIKILRDKLTKLTEGK